MSAAPVRLNLTDDVLRRAGTLAGGLPLDVDVEELLTIRARMDGLRSRGRISPGGSCRLLPTADGWVAVNLARRSDVESVPAIVEGSPSGDPWAAIEAYAGSRRAAEVAARCQLLGVAAAELGDPTVQPFLPSRQVDATPPASSPRVVDLTAMWAGPLCARLLGLLGWHVTKVESTDRPDGARFGNPAFYRWLHDGHAELRLDLRSAAGRMELAELIDDADVVLESSRPRALAQLGIDAAAFVAGGRGRVWVSITGYGRRSGGGRVAFGDDAAVAGGLVARDDAGTPTFCGDAIADPLSGMAAAAAAYGAIAAGRGHLIDVPMAGVARAVAAGHDI